MKVDRARVEELLKQNIKGRDIAKAMNISAASVYQISKSLKNPNISIEDATEKQRKIIDLYLQGMKPKNIAIEMNIQTSNVYYILKTYNVFKKNETGISERQQQVLDLYNKGLINSEIAKELGISQTRVHQLIHKLTGGKRNRYNKVERTIKAIEESGVVFTSFKEMRKQYSKKVCLAYSKKVYFNDSPENRIINLTNNELFARKNTNRLWHRWKSMRYRCCNPNCSIYSYYGGRGITVCDEWLYGTDEHDGFDTFAIWAIDNGYIDGMQKQLHLDRIDNSKGYSPDNCRWVDPITNGNNRSNNIRILHEGKYYSINDYAEISNLTSNYVRQLCKINKLEYIKLKDME